ncbi:Aconitase/3-isopropylmalate dehydratase [Xylaria sp. FL0043]|nr:Aconitase/3-isopropylmalate dehydratase [Xylaria sp. FL0043]
MAQACMENYDPSFDSNTRPNDIFVGGYNLGTGSSREQAATALLAKQIPLIVAGSFGNIFARNCINNAMMTLTLSGLVERLRVCFPAPSPSAEDTRHPLTRRTGWTLTWDIQRSVVEVREGEQGETWVEKVGDLPANAQAIIAAGGLESWCRAEIKKTAEAL